MKLHAIAALTAVLCAGSALAQQSTEQPSAQPSFEFARLDKNKDGFLSRQEAQANKNVAALFDRADTNKDGRLSEDELTRARAAQDREKADQYSSDAAITTKVKAELLTEKGVPSSSISVETYKGTVQLSGFVENAEQVKKAGAVAAKVKGVKAVKNNLIVK
jgi:osmotically-inducible protein OsmY